MKTTIYELLGMIKDGKAPKKILFDNQIWNYRERTDMEGTILYEEYINEETGRDLFDEYLILDILNDEVKILETIKPELGTIICYKKGETNNAGYIGVVEKVNEDGSVCLKQNDKIEKLSYQQIGSWALIQHNWVDYARAVDKQVQQIGRKINEIIDKVKKL